MRLRADTGLLKPKQILILERNLALDLTLTDESTLPSFDTIFDRTERSLTL